MRAFVFVRQSGAGVWSPSKHAAALLPLFWLALAVVAGQGCRAEDGPDSLAAVLSGSQEQRQLKFDQGIGFYWAADSVTHFLRWPQNPRGRVEDADVLVIPPDARFFAYGLDFSQSGGMGKVLPPHVLGYGITYKEPAGERRGRWAVHFVPIGGYDQPVYEVVPPSWPHEGLKDGRIEHQFWALDIATSATSDAYLFRFDSGYEEARKEARARLEGALSDSDIWHGGVVRSRTLVADPSVVSFEIRFVDFDPDDGTVSAEARSGEDQPVVSLEGEIVSAHRLVLTNPVNGIIWDFDHPGGGYLVAEYSNGTERNTVTLNLVEPEPEADDEE